MVPKSDASTLDRPTAQDTPPDLHLLWINAGLSCDGDSVALTAATQPSIEDVARRAKRFGCRIDRCYALVGTLRQHWHGVTGGEAARVALEDFFGDLRHA